MSNQAVRSQSEAHLERGQNAAGNDDEKPKVHVEELANHVGHVRWEYEEEQAEAHSTEVFPQAPGQTQESLSVKAVTIRFLPRAVRQGGRSLALQALLVGDGFLTAFPIHCSYWGPLTTVDHWGYGGGRPRPLGKASP